MTTATKGVQADAGSGGSLGGGRLRLRCRVICDLDSLDGYQQLCRSVVVSKGAHGVFPVDGVLQLYGDGGRGGVCSSLSPAGTHCLAPQLFVSDHREDVSVGLRHDCFQVAMPLRRSRSYGLHGIQVVVHMQLRHADSAYRRGVTQ
jgi:hypothetical protein